MAHYNDFLAKCQNQYVNLQYFCIYRNFIYSIYQGNLLYKGYEMSIMLKNAESLFKRFESTLVKLAEKIF